VNRAEREAAVRRIMQESAPRVPPELYGDALSLGRRTLRRRVAARRLMWLLLCAAALAFTVWAVTARPWERPPSQTTPPLPGW
jgi:ferric-dicitrate binding protein FerR (iron transport regulator)